MRTAKKANQPEHPFASGYVVVEKTKRVTRLYYAYDKDGHPFFGGPFAAFVFADIDMAQRAADRSEHFTGKEFRVMERIGTKEVET